MSEKEKRAPARESKTPVMFPPERGSNAPKTPEKRRELCGERAKGPVVRSSAWLGDGPRPA